MKQTDFFGVKRKSLHKGKKQVDKRKRKRETK